MKTTEIIHQLYPLLLEKYNQVADVELGDFYGIPAIYIEGPGLSISFVENDSQFVGEIWICMKGDAEQIPWNEGRIYRFKRGENVKICTYFYPTDVDGSLDLLADAERDLQAWVLKLLCREGGI